MDVIDSIGSRVCNSNYTKIRGRIPSLLLTFCLALLITACNKNHDIDKVNNAESEIEEAAETILDLAEEAHGENGFIGDETMDEYRAHKEQDFAIEMEYIASLEDSAQEALAEHWSTMASLMKQFVEAQSALEKVTASQYYTREEANILQDHIVIAKDYIDANNATRKYMNSFEYHVKESLEANGVDEEESQQIIIELFEGIDIVRPMYNENFDLAGNFGTAFLAELEFLEEHVDDWEYNPRSKRVDFRDTSMQSAFDHINENKVKMAELFATQGPIAQRKISEALASGGL